ncbi:MAG: hypothetical protein ACRCRZ_03095 [Metamycoplasmataceae bacterium]
MKKQKKLSKSTIVSGSLLLLGAAGFSALSFSENNKTTQTEYLSNKNISNFSVSDNKPSNNKLINNDSYYIMPNGIKKFENFNSDAEIKTADVYYQKLIDNIKKQNPNNIDNNAYKTLITTLESLNKKDASNPQLFDSKTYLFYETMRIAFSGIPNGDEYFNLSFPDYKGFEQFVPTDFKIEPLLKELSGIISVQDIISTSLTLEGKTANVINLEDNSEKVINLNNGGYDTFVKIATIDSSVKKDIIFNFSYNGREETNNSSSRGFVVLKNNNGQLSSKTLEENINDYQIFGRWDMRVGDEIATNSSFPPLLNTFEFQKKANGEIDVFIKLKTGQQINNVKVDPNSRDAIKQFGILDVQQEANSPIIDSTSQDILKEIEFFSNSLTFNKVDSTNQPSSLPDNLKNVNKKLTYYVGKDVQLSLKSFYNSKTGTKEKILVVNNGEVSLNEQFTLKLGIDGDNNPFDVAKSPLELYISLLDDIINSDLIKQNPELINMGVNSSNSNALPNIWEQSLYYNGTYFDVYEESGLATAEKILLDTIDPSLKYEAIFNEKPKKITSFDNSIWSVSESKAVEDKKGKVLNVLQNIYTEWSKKETSSTNKFTFQTDKIVQFSLLEHLPLNGGKYYNISLDTKITSETKTGNEIYETSRIYFNNLKNIINQLLPNLDPSLNSFSQNIFDINSSNAAYNSKRAIETFLQLSGRGNEVIDLVHNIIQKTTKIDDITPEQKKQVEVELATLVSQSYSSLQATFSEQFKIFFLSQLQTYIKSNEEAKNQSIIDLSKISYDATERIFYLNSSDSILKNEITTNSDRIKSLIDLMYLGNGTSEFLGQGIFGININDDSLPINQNAINFVNLFINKNLLTFETTIDKLTSANIESIFNFYDVLFTTFGNQLDISNSNMSLTALRNEAFKNGNAIELKWDVNNKKINGPENAFDFIFDQLNAKHEVLSIGGVPNQEARKINMLISSANLSNILAIKSGALTNNKTISVPSSEEEKKLYRQALTFNNLLPLNLFKYQEAFKNIYPDLSFNNLDEFTTYLSSKEGAIDLAEKMNKEVIEYAINLISQNGLQTKGFFFSMVKQIAPIFIALVAAGIIVVSSFVLVNGVKTKSISKFSKILLILLIVISIASLVLSGLIIPSTFL